MSLTAPHPRRLHNSAETFGSIAKALHWLTALLIMAVIPLGLVAERWPHDSGEALAVKATLFSAHKTLGLAVFFVALLRILWALAQPRPAPLHPERRLETLAAETVHWALYAALVLVPLSGWVHHAATTGFAPIWWPFGQSLPFVPQSPLLASLAGAAHGLFAWLLIGALVLHIGGALKHHLIDRDAVLRRMLPGQPALARVEAPHKRHGLLPPLLAMGAFLALAMVAFQSTPAPAAQNATVITAPVSAETTDGWQVLDGRLEIAVTQMGQRVSGSFAGWAASITFDETRIEGPLGAVEVVIDIASLQLGSVTSQALAADFFDVANHATARFSAEIRAHDGTDGGTDDGAEYLAEGMLELVGRQVPVALPFRLSIEGDEARMQGALTLDRRDFDIGASYPDERSVGFAVSVDVALSARRER